MRFTTVSSKEIAAAPDQLLNAGYWIAKRQLEAEDSRGAPYIVPFREFGTDGPDGHVIPGELITLDYNMALAIARSAHPSRVLAITSVYRYGKFTEWHDGSVQVTMMGSHIATFTPEGVRLWWRGHVTQSSTEALSSLVTGGWFYTVAGVIKFRRYADGGDWRSGTDAEEGALYPYGEVSA